MHDFFLISHEIIDSTATYSDETHDVIKAELILGISIPEA